MCHPFTIFTFPSTYYALKAEGLVKNAGLNGRLIPVPREVSSLCGLALELETQEAERALGILSAHVQFEKEIEVIKKNGFIVRIVQTTNYS